jgi:small subunit ribosomal protein S6
MPVYETVLIARQDLNTTQVEELTSFFTDFIKKDGGTILKTENWGLRALAYRIKKNRKGHYVLIETDTPPAALLEMERNMRLHEDLLRYMTIRLDEPSKGPSVILGGGSDRDRPHDSDRSNDNLTVETIEKDVA